MATGAATTPKRMRFVSSEPKTYRSSLRRFAPALGILTSDLHDFCFLRLDQLVHFVDVVVVYLLQLLLGVLDVVFRHPTQLLQLLAGVSARVTNGDPAVFRVLVDDLDELLAA